MSTKCNAAVFGCQHKHISRYATVSRIDWLGTSARLCGEFVDSVHRDRFDDIFMTDHKPMLIYSTAFRQPPAVFGSIPHLFNTIHIDIVRSGTLHGGLSNGESESVRVNSDAMNLPKCRVSSKSTIRETVVLCSR